MLNHLTKAVQSHGQHEGSLQLMQLASSEQTVNRLSKKIHRYVS